MSDSEEEEEFLVHVEFNGMLQKDVLQRAPVFFKMIGAEDRRPVMQIGNQTFVGEYRDIVGTALFFEEDPVPAGSDPVFTKSPDHQLRYAFKTRKALHMSRVFLKKKTSEGVDSKHGADSDSDPTDDTCVKPAYESKNTVNILHENSSCELTMEVDEYPQVGTMKEQSSKCYEPGPSRSPLESGRDVVDLETVMEATASKSVTPETSRLIEEQIKVTSDAFNKMVTESQ